MHNIKSRARSKTGLSAWQRFVRRFIIATDPAPEYSAHDRRDGLRNGADS
ncbi:hypothetical protein EDF18_0938 [Frigoribacterium sp. PhB107]|nr:hypothetical protein [Frigoribacterium sp. PhB107]ROP78292.1 hypothetical protein EDF18_0938 [Frigoribacterium sp. PhB107]